MAKSKGSNQASKNTGIISDIISSQLTASAQLVSQASSMLGEKKKLRIQFTVLTLGQSHFSGYGSFKGILFEAGPGEQGGIQCQATSIDYGDRILRGWEVRSAVRRLVSDRFASANNEMDKLKLNSGTPRTWNFYHEGGIVIASNPNPVICAFTAMSGAGQKAPESFFKMALHSDLSREIQAVCAFAPKQDARIMSNVSSDGKEPFVVHYPFINLTEI